VINGVSSVEKERHIGISDPEFRLQVAKIIVPAAIAVFIVILHASGR